MSGDDRRTTDVETSSETKGNAKIGHVILRDDDRSSGTIETGGIVGPHTGSVFSHDVNTDAIEGGGGNLQVPGCSVKSH